MKKSVFAVLTASMLLTQGAYAASDAFIEQLGPNLTTFAASQMVSIEDVTSTLSSAAIALQAVRSQYSNATSSSSLLVQSGDYLRASINQSGPGNVGVVYQSGWMNSTNLMQIGANNTALVIQAGSRNFASVSQAGANHSAFVSQRGSGNVAIISQR